MQHKIIGLYYSLNVRKLKLTLLLNIRFPNSNLVRKAATLTNVFRLLLLFRDEGGAFT
jgi:hypothetical protein